MSRYFPKVWLKSLSDLIDNGKSICPRGEKTFEIMQRTMVVDMRRPVLTVPGRKLNYKFMAAEAFWILSGDNRVETIAPYNENISKFSDDGVKFHGAYGPKIVDQMSYVVGKLLEDSHTRQAGLTIWRECPPKTKDVPCTVAMFFYIRGNKLHASVYMRSSDIWLGVPYDVFNFSMIAHCVCAFYNSASDGFSQIEPGLLHLTAGSSHIYERDVKKAFTLTEYFMGGARNFDKQNPTPAALFSNHEYAMGTLKELRESKPGDAIRWWEI